MAYDPNRPLTEEEFVTIVAQAARIGGDRAERAVQATLEFLRRSRIRRSRDRDRGEARQGRLPGARRAFSAKEFAGLVAELPKAFLRFPPR